MNCQVLVSPLGTASTYQRQCYRPATFYREVNAVEGMVGFCGQHWAILARRSLPITDHGRHLFASPLPARNIAASREREA